jgi:O-methyltransferase
MASASIARRFLASPTANGRLQRVSNRSATRAIRRQYRGGWRPPPATRVLTRRQRLHRAKNWAFAFIIPKIVLRGWERWSWPLAALFLLTNRSFHPSYAMTIRRKALLAWRMQRTTRRVFTGTSYRAHLAMAAKLLEKSPREIGVVVECGSFQGGSTANLSLLCAITGRKLVVYDSFEGLPAPTPGDRLASPSGTGLYAGSLEAVHENVRRFGNLDVCIFRKGWFADTLPRHTEPVVLAYVDVDYQASLHDCILGLWPHLTERGYLFVDEFVVSRLCALFWSERYWKKYFNTTPPGLIGSGSGIPLGGFYVGPWPEKRPILAPFSTAYTRKDLLGYWDFYPEDDGTYEPG